MTVLERKIDVLLRVVTAEDDMSRQTALEEAKELRMAGTVPAQQKNAEDIRLQAEALLTEIGVPNSLSGFDYLADGICMLAEDRKLRFKVTKELYPRIASRNRKTTIQVERSMRHAIETAFMRADQETILRHFGGSISKETGKATNREFMARLAREIETRVQ